MLYHYFVLLNGITLSRTKSIDIEVSESDAIEEKKQEAHNKIEQLDPEQLQKALELLAFRQQRFQRVVGEEEAEQLISEGWQYVGTLPNGKIIAKKIWSAYHR